MYNVLAYISIKRHYCGLFQVHNHWRHTPFSLCNWIKSYFMTLFLFCWYSIWEKTVSLLFQLCFELIVRPFFHQFHLKRYHSDDRNIKCSKLFRKYLHNNFRKHSDTDNLLLNIKNAAQYSQEPEAMNMSKVCGNKIFRKITKCHCKSLLFILCLVRIVAAPIAENTIRFLQGIMRSATFQCVYFSNKVDSPE